MGLLFRKNYLTNWIKNRSGGGVTPTGTISITENGTYDVEQYKNASVSVQSGKLTNVEYAEAMSDVNTILNGTNTPNVVVLKSTEAVVEIDPAGISGRSTFMSYVKKIYDLDLSNYTAMTSVFQNSYRLEEIGIIGYPNTIMDYASIFEGCGNLITAPTFTGAKVQRFDRSFRDCTNLVNVPIWDTTYFNVFGLNGTFANCPNLSDESLNNIMQTCIDATSKITVASYRTLKTVGLSSSQATTCMTLSNYTAFVNAGWTTGY